jgi:hypothetical protein
LPSPPPAPSEEPKPADEWKQPEPSQPERPAAAPRRSPALLDDDRHPPKFEPPPTHSLPAVPDHEVAGANVSFIRCGAQPVDGGQAVAHKTVVRNNGETTVKVIEVEEAVPAEHALQSTDPPAQAREGVLRWRLENLAPREERTLVMTVAPRLRPAAIHASDQAPSAPRPLPSPVDSPPAARNVSASDTPTPEVQLQLIGPSTVVAGQACRIGFRATNPGGDAANLKLHLDLPDGLQFARGRRLEYKIGRLAHNESREDYLTAAATTSGTVEIRACLIDDRGARGAETSLRCHVRPPEGGPSPRGVVTPVGGEVVPQAPCLCWP